MNQNTMDAMLEDIALQTKHNNKDNISRTKAYQTFYMHNKEIHWSFLASMVSRNAGWNMTDLQTPPLCTLLNDAAKKNIFMTYERANWLIFSDAYPQLLLYAFCKAENQPMFHLLRHFSVSSFMIKEWENFWYHSDYRRLVTALIINEQNVIQKPVIRQSFYSKTVFHKAPYLVQDFFNMSAVLFPTLTGEVYGAYVHDFSNVSKRIKLGKQLSALLFHPEYSGRFLDFALWTEPTGSRNEYEQYFTYATIRSPMLRRIYPVIQHKDTIRKEWCISGRSVRKKWWKQEDLQNHKDVSHRFYAKRTALQALIHVMDAIHHQ
ncbi:DUF2515 family protein [Pontibacillus salicampi]|uniref:DUF2515 family protein n=1 Tax=Pontibacillus salicampi TaxID=1449801 RepID=A0ABV6LLB0_9BACI